MHIYVKQPSVLQPSLYMIPITDADSNSPLEHTGLSLPALRPLTTKDTTRAGFAHIEACSSSSSSSGASSSSPAVPSVFRLSRKNQRLLLLHRRSQNSPASSAPFGDTATHAKGPVCSICWQSGCKLKTHRQYTYRQNDTRSVQLRPRDQNLVPNFTFTIASSAIDPFVELPIGVDTAMQRLFRDFFTSQGTKMTDPVRARSFDNQYYAILAPQAMVDPALCHTCIAMSATYAAIHGQGLRRPDAKLLAIYDRTFRVLREQIAQSNQRRPSDSTIMAAVNLLFCHGISFGDQQAMDAHPAALQNIVNICGGITNLTGQLAALTLWSDFYVTLHTGRMPMFLEQVGVMPEVLLLNPPTIEYGNGFLALEEREVISSSLLEVCNTTCRLTELLEDKVRGEGSLARWEYFLYRRNSIAMRSGIVHSDLFGSGTKAECIGIVNNLLLFLVLRLMPWKMPLLNLSDQLRLALTRTGLKRFWNEDISALTWILFVVLAVDEWDGREWALQLLLETLTHRYSCKKVSWPPNWREMQRLNLMDFAWSDIYLTTSFKTTCRDLGSSYREQPLKSA